MNMYQDIATKVGTPCYVYSRAKIEANYARLKHAFNAGNKPRQTLINYAVKANSNFEILRLLKQNGAAFDVVSAGEMLRVLRIGAHPKHITFAGVGKRDDELRAALAADIGWLSVESVQELQVLNAIALGMNKKPRIMLRINPGVDAHTHAYLSTGVANSKFGIEAIEAKRILSRWRDFAGVSIEGIHFHIGSMVHESAPFVTAAEIALDVIAHGRVMGAPIHTLDTGGGFAVAYTPDQPKADIEGIAKDLVQMAHDADVHLHIEPGRCIVADACVLLTQVLYTKQNGNAHYAIVDAAMNDLIRPSLYGAVHAVEKVHVGNPVSLATKHYEVVGPICESGDFLAHHAHLPELQRGALLLVHHAGAYGMSMASHYNSRPRAAEIMLEHNNTWRTIRPRENLNRMFSEEMGN